jgi:large subunit ribosomal protein L9
MKVVLNDHVEHLGDRGTVCVVKPGFARNFLIPKGLAYEATAANMARFQQGQKRWTQGEAKAKGQAEAVASQLAGIELRFVRRAGEGDALYGSVTTSDVAAALAEKGFPIDRRKIEIGQHVKRLGSYAAELHLHQEVRVPITLHVEREGGEEQA